MARFTQDESPIVKLAAAEGITVDEYIERQEIRDHGDKRNRLQDKLDEESLREKKSGKTLLGEYDKKIEKKAKLNRPEDKDFSDVKNIAPDDVGATGQHIAQDLSFDGKEQFGVLGQYGTAANVKRVVMYDEVVREVQLPGFGAPMQEWRTMEIVGHIEVDKLSLQHMAVEDLVCLRDMCANVLDEKIKTFGRVTFNK
jgi:hypothetical protein